MIAMQLHEDGPVCTSDSPHSSRQRLSSRAQDALETSEAIRTARVVRGSDDYWRINVALFLAGFSAFSLVFCTQPLFLTFTKEFHLSPAQSSLSLSLTTGLLAVAIFCMSVVAESFLRKKVMFASLCGAAFLNFAAALAPNWPMFLAARAAEGVVLGGVPAVAMAYVSEEVAPSELGLAMGLYVGSTGFGGMMGRVGMGLLNEFTTWRIAMAIMGAFGFTAAIGFRILLPPSRQFTQQSGTLLSFHFQAWKRHLEHRSLLLLFMLGFLNLGVMVTVLNYLGFRLSAAPYCLSQTTISLLFLVYLPGMVASSVGGNLADRFGRSPVLIFGILVTGAGLLAALWTPLAAVGFGFLLITIGFFITHSVASGWVGTLARSEKGHATSLYLLAYYVGGSLIGSFGGWFWSKGGWLLLTVFSSALLISALVLALLISRQKSPDLLASPLL